MLPPKECWTNCFYFSSICYDEQTKEFKLSVFFSFASFRKLTWYLCTFVKGHSSITFSSNTVDLNLLFFTAYTDNGNRKRNIRAHRITQLLCVTKDTYRSTTFAMILYWIHCRAFDAEYSVKIAKTTHRLVYTRNSPAFHGKCPHQMAGCMVVRASKWAIECPKNQSVEHSHKQQQARNLAECVKVEER